MRGARSEAGTEGAECRGKPWRTTGFDPAASRPADLVERDFTATRPDESWVADFTYLRCWEGVVFFSFVSDVFPRRIVGWQFATHMRTDLVLDAAESFVDTFKTELIAGRVWRTRGQLALAIVEWVAWFNTERLHESLGDVPPTEFEQLYTHKPGLRETQPAST